MPVPSWILPSGLSISIDAAQPLFLRAQELLDIVFTVGQYHLVSMALNTFRVERDDGVTGVPFPPTQ